MPTDAGRHGCLRPNARRALPALVAALLAILALLPPAASAQSPDPAQGEPQAPAVSAPAEAPEPAQAQPPAAEQADKALQELERLKLIVDRIEAAAQRESLSDTELGDLRREIDPVQEQALAIANSILPRTQAVEERLKQLGPAPEEGKSESELITAERAQQNELLAKFQAVVKQGRLLSVRAEQLSARIIERRRALFTDKIFERRSSAFSPVVWFDAIAATPKVASRLALLMSDWWGSLAAKLDGAALAAIGVALILIGMVSRPIRRRLLRFGARDPALTQPPRLTKTVAAGWLAMVHVAVPTAALLLLYTAFSLFGLLPERIDRLFVAVIRSVAQFSLIQGLSWAMFAPSRPTWRMFPLENGNARRLHVLTIATGAVYALGELADTVNAVTFAPLAVLVGKDILTSILIAVLIGIALFIARPRPLPAGARPAGMIRWPWIFAAGWAGVLAIPLAAALGFLALAGFIAAQLVIGGAILAMLMLAMWLIDAFLSERIEGPDGAAETVAKALGTGREAVVQTGILLGGILRVVVVLVAASFLLVPWGIESKDVFGWLRTAFFGFTVGDFRISISSVLLAIAIFLIGAFITRAIQRWLDQRLLPHTKLDTGIRNSLKTAFGYLGLIVAAAIGFAYLGLDLSNLAIVAGALSVGIGFGLQSVVNNFVSGLILLAERPIKAGDWIVVGSEEGYVSKISVRSTQIETFDRATVIVPNSDLISGVVKNWMHNNRIGRVRIAVGVSYAADPEKVRELLLACAEAHPGVLRDPEPRVFFMDFGPSSLDFELRAYIGNIDSGLTVRSDLRFAILKALRAAGIEIPFPQQDVHLRDIDRLEKALAGERADKTPARAKRQRK